MQRFITASVLLVPALAFAEPDLGRTDVALSVIDGFVGASASYAVLDHLALRGEVHLYDGHDLLLQLGASAQWFPLSSDRHGLFGESGLFGVASHETSDTAYMGVTSTTRRSLAVEALAGWQWRLFGNFTIAASAGVAHVLNPDAEADFTTFPLGEARIGYTF